MGKKKIEQDLRDAGLRKKRARKVAKAADRGRAGDRAARELVEQHSAALRDSVSAVLRYAKPPRSKSAKKASAKKSSAKRTSTKRAPARRRRTTSRSGTRSVDLQVDCAKGTDKEARLRPGRRHEGTHEPISSLAADCSHDIREPFRAELTASVPSRSVDVVDNDREVMCIEHPHIAASETTNSSSRFR